MCPKVFHRYGDFCMNSHSVGIDEAMQRGDDAMKRGYDAMKQGYETMKR
jgi:hypothetical protein